MQPFHPSIFILFISLFVAIRADVSVTVGPDLAFHPNVVYGNPGELVNFQFAGSGFSASEATARLNDPCNTEGGFDSGVENAGATFSIIISTHNSIYVFSQNQCHLGMVMIVNPGPSDSVQHYASIASNGNIQTGGGGGGGGASSTLPSSSTPSSSSHTTSSSPTSTSTSMSAVTTTNSSSIAPTSTTNETSSITSLITSTTGSKPSSQADEATANLPSRIGYATISLTIMIFSYSLLL